MGRLVLIEVFVLLLCASLSLSSNSCYTYVRESFRATTSQGYNANCGIWGWNWQRCTRYRLLYRQGYQSRRTCCNGWTGNRCDEAICNPSCLNGGTCTRPNFCSCPSGFSPPRCDRNFACASNPCQHGSCQEYHSHYSCSCQAGWQGTTCNIVVNCGNPGSINNGIVTGNRFQYGDTVHFTCNENYTLVGHPSARCQANGQWSASKPQCLFGNTCHSNPCQNGGTCINGVEQHECVCTEGWSGERCETDISPPRVEFCPVDKNITAVDNRVTVIWQSPTFTDWRNETLQITSNYPGNVETFPWGQYVVHYTAIKPLNGLRSFCEFTIRVYPRPCPTLDPPAHGAMACNGWITRLGRVCKTFCQQGWTLPRGEEDKLNQLYVCGAHGSWLPPATLNCSAETSGVSEVSGFFPGNCTSTDAINSIKAQYLSELRNSSFSKICTSWHDLCLADNVDVSCGGN